MNKTLNEGEIVLATPKQGNIHELEAIEDVAVLGSLLPHYDFENGRRCDYYELADFSVKKEQLQPGTETKLRYLLPPNSFEMETVGYRGDL